jgi:excinuclease ABC subunit A
MNLPISIRGARQYNLKGIDADLPKQALIVLAGPSGSGKSTLAVDTLFAEARRRFLDCLSTKDRNTFELPDPPDVDSITGLPPALCLEQSPGFFNPRQLLGNITELADFLRVLYATAGTPHDPTTGAELVCMTPDRVIDDLLAFPEGTKLTLVSPMAPSLFADTQGLRSSLSDFLRQGFLRVAMDHVIQPIDDLLAQETIGQPDQLALVIDRIVLRGEASASRLADSVQTALRLSPDEIQGFLQTPDHDEQWLSFYMRYRNPETGFVLPHLSPKHFSYNSPLGFCPDCQGTGMDPTTPTTSRKNRGTISAPCPTCGGSRLNALARAVTLSMGNSKYNLPELLHLSLEDLKRQLDDLVLPTSMAQPCQHLMQEIHKRLGFLNGLGLGYLSLDRPAPSLSGGELQRARLASQLGGGLSGVLYILDEPTIGLHPADTHRLIQALTQLRDLGNTLLVIEHDEQVMQAADLIVDMGPGSGPLGGRILAMATPDDLPAHTDSPTGQWLSGKLQMPEAHRDVNDTTPRLTLHGAKANNLQNITFTIPLGRLTSLSGPSGSGKSSLVMDCLLPALNGESQGNTWERLEGQTKIDRVIVIDQSPIGKSPRSTPATATGLMQVLRPLFASLPLSKQRGYSASRFSTNTRGGRCEKCLGLGQIEVDLQFLGKVHTPCDACHGLRYNRETLEVTWRGKSIAEVQALTVDEAVEFFKAIPKAHAILLRLQQVGLGYLSLDRPADTLSGGEAQRIKIATELARIIPNRIDASPALFILDEPTTGLHFREVSLLIQALHDLRDAGHTVLCIEHNTDILLSSDYIIDMGPGAGSQGGSIVDQGTPDQIMLRQISPTAPWLSKRASEVRS